MPGALFDRRQLEQRIHRQRVGAAGVGDVRARLGQPVGLGGGERVGSLARRALRLPRRPRPEHADRERRRTPARSRQPLAQPLARRRPRARSPRRSARGRPASPRTAARARRCRGRTTSSRRASARRTTTHDRQQRQQPDALGRPRRAPRGAAQPDGRGSRRPARRPAAPATAAMPDDAEVGERLHDVAVGVAHVERRRCGSAGAPSRSRRRRRRAPGARLEDLQRLVPVARAHAADRGQAAGVVGRRARRWGRSARFQPLRDRAAQPAVGERERAGDGRPAPARAATRIDDAGLAARREPAARGARARSRSPAPRRSSTSDHRDEQRRRARGRRSRAGRSGTLSLLSASCENAHSATSTAAERRSPPARRRRAGAAARRRTRTRSRRPARAARRASRPAAA